MRGRRGPVAPEGHRAAAGPVAAGRRLWWLRAAPERPGGYQELNAKMVVEFSVICGPSTVLGKSGSLGEFGKCWVSNV